MSQVFYTQMLFVPKACGKAVKAPLFLQLEAMMRYDTIRQSKLNYLDDGNNSDFFSIGRGSKSFLKVHFSFYLVLNGCIEAAQTVFHMKKLDNAEFIFHRGLYLAW